MNDGDNSREAVKPDKYRLSTRHGRLARQEPIDFEYNQNAFYRLYRHAEALLV